MLLFLFALFLWVGNVLPNTAYAWDRTCFVKWAVQIHTGGLGTVYQSGTDYLPFYHYILYFFVWWEGSTEAIRLNINTLKIFSLFFDFLGAWVAYQILRKAYPTGNRAFFSTALIVGNIAYLYNSAIWGQADTIYSTLLFIAFYFAIHRNVVFTLLFCVLSISMKLQAVVYLPFLGLLILPTILQTFSFINVLKWGLTVFLSLFLLLLPFLIEGGIVTHLYRIIYYSTKLFPSVSNKATNIWYLVLENNPANTPDSQYFMGNLSYRQVGLSLYFACYLFLVYPLCKNVFFALKRKETQAIPLEKLLQIGALIGILFFFLNTQMHERYIHAAFIFLSTYSFLKRQFLSYFLFCIAYVLNLDIFMHYLSFIPADSILYEPFYIACLYLLAILFLIIDWGVLFKNKS